MREKESVVDEFTESPIMLNQGEINALKKAILYLKFDCEETSSLIYTGSELINSAFDKLVAGSRSADRERKFYNTRNTDVEEHVLKKINDQREFDGEMKAKAISEIEYFEDYIHPFKSE